jgi:large subunit ribosomal protein L16
MRIPKKTKFRKIQRGSMKGVSKGAKDIAFGDYGLVALEPAWMTAQQIEAMRVSLSRHLKKGGSLFLRVFADKPITKKPAETRMGKGKGAVEGWVSVVKRKRILVEIAGVAESVAKKILHTASCKLPMRTRFISRDLSN